MEELTGVPPGTVVEVAAAGVVVLGLTAEGKPWVPGVSVILETGSLFPPVFATPCGVVTLEGVVAAGLPVLVFLAWNSGGVLCLPSRQLRQFSQPTRAIPAHTRPTSVNTGFLPIGFPFPISRANQALHLPCLTWPDSFPGFPTSCLQEATLSARVNSVRVARSQGRSSNPGEKVKRDEPG